MVAFRIIGDSWSASIKGVFIGGLIGTIMGLAGFWLAEIPTTHAMGLVMFLLVPFAAGFGIAMVTQQPNALSAAAALALIASLAVLVGTGAETPLCAVLAFPLLFVGLVIGIVLGIYFRKLITKLNALRGASISIALVAMPLLIFAGHREEAVTLVQSRQEIVTDHIRLEAIPDQVWTNLLSFDYVKAPKPLLMYIGLPIPTRCVMQGSGSGATRTCYFDRGYIEEIVAEWSPPRVMGLLINRTNMPGRLWLGFEDAKYVLDSVDWGTVLTRTTTITSNLYPAWYRRPFERWGVSSEHRFIFADLARRTSP